MSGSSNTNAVWPWDVYNRDKKQSRILGDWMDENPYPAVPDPFGQSAATARLAEEKRIRAAMGYASTVLTGGRGLGAARTTARARIGGM